MPNNDTNKSQEMEIETQQSKLTGLFSCFQGSTVYNIPTNNRFSPIQPIQTPSNESNPNENEETGDNQNEETNEQTPNQNNKKLKSPPPIVFHQTVTDHKRFTETIKTTVKNGFHIKYNKQNTNLFIHDRNEYEHYLLDLAKEEGKIAYHTYTSNHPANSTKCPEYIKKIEQMQKRQANLATSSRGPAKTARYISAPMPSINPWNNGKPSTTNQNPSPPTQQQQATTNNTPFNNLENVENIVGKDTLNSETDTKNSEVNILNSEKDTTNSELNAKKCETKINDSEKDTNNKGTVNIKLNQVNVENNNTTTTTEMIVDDNTTKNMDLSSMFVKPSTSRGTGKPTPKPPTIPLKNRFAPLENDENEEDDDNDSIELGQNKPKKPPPLVIHAKTTDHKTYVKSLENEINKGFHIKYTANNTNLYIYDHEEYKKYKEILNEGKVEYHTYTPKADRKHAFILRGLDNSTDTEEIIEDLEEKYKLNVEKTEPQTSNTNNQTRHQQTKQGDKTKNKATVESAMGRHP
ncbi:probable serine/threonine-protein kinase DDB_G0278845 [Chrysoperla carnea]|uniref:probable serine/threonine-protein kinase DDB_G0278845 n=1 Tax=Chrysoperla carnea TaxID=189513 RepID=UPI001D064E9E|nr:probable serine/threonine-protein kinase DDB_G0278845 [Chrysoperla carnea]